MYNIISNNNNRNFIECIQRFLWLIVYVFNFQDVNTSPWGHNRNIFMVTKFEST